MKYKKIDSKEKLEYNVKRLSQTCIREFQMRYTNYSIKNRKGKHINYEERIKLEALLVFAIERIKTGKQFFVKMMYTLFCKLFSR